jgi:hypothetical protein
MTEQEQHIKQLRAWLYELLAQLELCDDVEAERTATNIGTHIQFDIQLKKD